MSALKRLLDIFVKHWANKPSQKRVNLPVRLVCEILEERALLAVNPIVLENQKPGNPISEWGISGAGDPSIQGFATDISVNKGQSIGFKINTDSRQYVIDIYRMGYYDGMGARKIDTITVRLNQPQTQPAPLMDATTGLIDAGNWRVSATWQVPNDAVSGIYFAKLTRLDGSGGSSHIYFVVRDDEGRSDILVQTSDTTWQAYNSWGGKSLYDYLSSGGQRAYKVSYNRPFDTRSRGVGDGQANFVFWAEYPLVRWLERNGYNVSYFTNVDTARLGHEIKEHKVFISVGHDEYWSGEMWQNTQAARDAGVHVVFLAGNNIYWKVRWEPSIDGTGTPYRTLVCYKESLADAKIDPVPNAWTGLWRDPRFSPPADGGIPENLLGGTIFTVNRGPDPVGTPIEVPYEFRQLRIWRYTDIQNLQPGQVAYLGQHTLGYEWNEDLDNGYRPPGQIRLSATTQQVPQKLLDYGKTVGPGVATHNLTLYRAPSKALVFSAGTVQWVWGLGANHDGPASATDIRMQQAMVNLLADMSVQPDTLQPDLVAALPSTDFQAPVVTITTPSGTTVQTNSTLVVGGTASDSGGGVVAGVEVSWNNGQTWHPAQGTNSWSYSWTPTVPGTYQFLVRAIDDSVNIGSASTISVVVTSDDVTPPQISGVNINVLPTRAEISWLTDEPADSIVYYGTDPSNLRYTVAVNELVLRHRVTLINLSPNTVYYFRFSSTDSSGNRSWYPANNILSFRTPAFVHDTYADFQGGSVSGGGTITAIRNGEVSLRARLQADFVEANLPNNFTVSYWASGGYNSIADNELRLEGAMIASTVSTVPLAILEFRAKFLAAPYQHIGFASDLNAGPWLIFSTKEGNGLYARSFATSTQETPLGTQWLGDFHSYRIEWKTNSVRYIIDDVVVAEHAINVTKGMSVVASDYTVNGQPLSIDWIRMGPYETAGSYLSPILDAGAPVFWDRVEWQADVPSGAALDISVRMGNSPSPDESWTSFIPVQLSGSRLSGTSRYIQYLVQMSATNPLDVRSVPKLDRMELFFSPAVEDVYGPSVIETQPADGSTVQGPRPDIDIYFNELLDSSTISAANVQVIHSATGRAISGSLQAVGNRVRWVPQEDLLAGANYTVVVKDIQDMQGNRMPQVYRWAFSVTGSASSSGRITQDTAQDFQGGTLNNTVIFDTGNGSIMLQPAFWDNFGGPQLSSQWATARWQPSGSVQVRGGAAYLDGSAILSSQAYSAGRAVEFRVILSGASRQQFGMMQDFVSRNWAMFSVENDGKLYAWTRSGAKNTRTVVSENWFNQYHVFRVDWLRNGVRYYIDGNLVATHNLNVTTSLRVWASDSSADMSPLAVDWVRLGPYAQTGSYISRVLDAGTVVRWEQVTWVAEKTGSTNLRVYLRTGHTPEPDTAWSSYVLISESGMPAGIEGRYAQYKLVLDSSDTFQTPLLDQISLNYSTLEQRSIIHSTVADLSQGATNQLVITSQGDGELHLKGKLYDDFFGSALDSQWTYLTWSSIGGGPATLQLANGLLSIGGSAIISNEAVGLVAVQARLNFANAGYQNFGLATGLDTVNNHVWLLFGTSPDGSRILARANVFGYQIDRDLGPIPAGLHTYRIVPYADRVDYLIDDNLVASIAINVPTSVSYRLVISDYYGLTPLIVDWAQASGFPTQGTYVSGVINGNAQARWTKLTYLGSVPVGTTVVIETRTGNTPIPDNSWSPWSSIDANGTISSPQAQYLQYRISLLTSDVNRTPIIELIRIEWLA